MKKNKKARETFIQKNLGLVRACVKRFINKGIEYDDLNPAEVMLSAGFLKGQIQIEP